MQRTGSVAGELPEPKVATLVPRLVNVDKHELNTYFSNVVQLKFFAICVNFRP